MGVIASIQVLHKPRKLMWEIFIEFICFPFRIQCFIRHRNSQVFKPAIGSLPELSNEQKSNFSLRFLLPAFPLLFLLVKRWEGRHPN